MLRNQVPPILKATETVYEPLHLSESGTSIVVLLGPRPSNCSVAFSRDKGKLLVTQAVGE